MYFAQQITGKCCQQPSTANVLVMATASCTVIAWNKSQSESCCLPSQVLHTRSCSGTGMSFVRFLAACYLTFNMDCLTVAKALETLPVLPLLHQVAGAAGLSPILEYLPDRPSICSMSSGTLA